MAQLTLPPDYFRVAAQKYAANPSNRKQWLIGQIDRAKESLLQYQVELEELAAELVALGAYPSQTWGLTVGGSVLASIPTGFTQVIGGALLISASFFAKAENKAKNQRIVNLMAVAAARDKEAQAVAKYYHDYVNELRWLTALPYILTGMFIYLILK